MSQANHEDYLRQNIVPIIDKNKFHISDSFRVNKYQLTNIIIFKAFFEYSFKFSTI